MGQVLPGDTVRVHYTGRFANGTVFDSSSGREPLEFTAGGPQVIPGVSVAVVGMAQGETKTVTIPPEEGYGHRDPAQQITVPTNSLPQGVKQGDQLRAVQGPQEIVVWVRDIGAETTVVDANHPLAGETLIFDLEIVSFESPPAAAAD